MQIYWGRLSIYFTELIVIPILEMIAMEPSDDPLASIKPYS